MNLSHPPLVEKLASLHRVAEVYLPCVATVEIRQCGGNTTLGHHRVRLAQQRLANQCRFGALGGRFDRSAQTGPARSDNDDVVFECLVFVHTSKNPCVGNGSRCNHPDVKIGETYHEQTDPSPQHVIVVQI